MNRVLSDIRDSLRQSDTGEGVSRTSQRPRKRPAEGVIYPAMEFGVLGPMRACRDDHDLPLGGPKQRALLALLLLRANEAVSRERLLDGLWGEQRPASAEHTLDNYVSRLRRLLGNDRVERRSPCSRGADAALPRSSASSRGRSCRSCKGGSSRTTPTSNRRTCRGRPSDPARDGPCAGWPSWE